MATPEVSLILPTQGMRSSLARAMQSAFAQDFGALEIVIVDDSVGGPPWTQRPEYAGLLSEPRVTVVPFHQGRGCAAAKNAGLRAARGRFVCYLDDDNEYLPTKVAAQHALAVRTRSPLVLCGIQIQVRSRRRLRQTQTAVFRGDELLLAVLPDTNVLFHRADVGVAWDESLGTGDDACFFQEFVAREHLVEVPNVPQALVVYHAHGGARANRSYERVYRGQRRLMIRWAPAFGGHARRILLLRTLVSACKLRSDQWCRLFRLGWQLVRTGGWREWRFVANAVGVKLPLIRRWMVT